MGNFFKIFSVSLSFLLLWEADARSYTVAKQQLIKVGNATEPKDLDPATVTGTPESHILDNLFEGLMAYQPRTLDPIPGVAESWSVSADGKVYTFKLRKNARWSDGVEVTAQDFVYSWIRALSPKTASEYAYQLFYVKNGEAFNAGKIKDPTQVGIKALDKYTLQVSLENPTPFFVRLTSFHTYYPVPPHVVEKEGKEWTKEGKLVSNGPFKLKEWKLNRHIHLARNEHYWDKEAVMMNEVIFYPVENTDTEEKMFVAGDLHMTSTVPTLKVPFYQSKMKQNPNQYQIYKNVPNLAVYFYRFNVRKKPMDDPRVRRALALTVDRKLIVERVTRGGQLPAGSFTPTVAGYFYQGQHTLPVSVTPEAIAEAKKLLKDAGYEDPKTMPKIELLYNTNEAHKQIAIAIQQMWNKNLGVEVELFNQEWKVYLDSENKGNFNVSRAGWVGDYPDPNTFLDMFVTNGGNNKTGWSNKDYDKMIDMAAETLDQAKRFDYFQKAEDLLLTELPILPIYFYTQQKLISEDVRMLEEGKITEWYDNITDRLLYKYYVLVDVKK
ncbi:MAG: peptide ABC transporter substrate-binding protein [Deltaproteobacteria bacterium]|nr:peptide ABC transporter substrate-binding protein [Deltaproteobacteria bacterium]